MSRRDPARRGRATPAQFWALLLGALVACRCGSGTGTGPETPRPPRPPLTSGTHGTAVRTVGAPMGRPVILYSDLHSAPPGAVVTFWGRDFGGEASGGRVEIDGVPVAQVIRWSDSQIDLKLPAQARSGPVVVRTVAGESPPFPFRVHRGSLWFVAPTGRDEAGGSEGQPFATIARGLQALRPGDVLYIRGGTYLPPPNEAFRALILLGEVPSGTEEQPIAIVGYAGEEVEIGDNTTQKVFSFGHDEPLEHITIAKLTLLPSCMAIETLDARHVRIVANEIAGARVNCGDSAITVGPGFDIDILGNDLHDNGSEKMHGVYLSGFGDCHDVEVAYNRIHDQSGGRAIQIYGHLRGDSISNVRIHSNEISEIDRDGIIVGHTDASSLSIHDILIANNVITRAGRCVGWAIRVDNPLADDVRIVHNTLVSNGTGDRRCYESLGEPQAQIGIERARTVTIANNVLVSSGRGGLLQLLDPRATILCSHNLYSGRGAACPSDDRPIRARPGFVDPRALDFRLGRGSAAIDAAAPSPIDVDAVGVARPAGAAPDIGALELDRPEQ